MTVNPFLKVEGLSKHFNLGHSRLLVAVDNVNLSVERTRTLAIVGESGSGKSTLARCLLGLIPPTSGSVLLNDVAISKLSAGARARSYADIQMVFQDPNSSLNPRMNVLQTVSEPLALHLGMPKRQRLDRARELMDLVKLSEDHLHRMPHELSGGQRQRVGIARALAVDQKMVILDEPTSALDVSTRREVLGLLERLQQQLGLTYIFISHDLQAVRQVADRIAVMYLGSILEIGPAEAILDSPSHPYTRALTSAAPIPEYGVTRERFRLVGEIPSPIGLKDQCRLVGRCPLAQTSCRHGVPPLAQIHLDHKSRCPITASQEVPIQS
jgi:oligopeptide/dipeptide ABC transporter ATP-binding protein